MEPISVPLKPLNDQILVEPLPEEEVTISGIVLPETAKGKPTRARVLAVGSGRHEHGTRIPLEVKVDDVVLHSPYAGVDITVGGADYLVLRESDVLAVEVP